MKAPTGKQILPIALLILQLAIVYQQARNNGMMREYGVLVSVLAQCTTPGSIVIIPALIIWAVVVNRKKKPQA